MLNLFRKVNKVSLLIILLIASNLYFVSMHIKYESLYRWHHLRYHELKKLFEYKEKYPIGTLADEIIQDEPDYENDHAWCNEDPNKLCVEPTISEWDYGHYCGFSFNFEGGKLVAIRSNSPCH